MRRGNKTEGKDTGDRMEGRGKMEKEQTKLYVLTGFLGSGKTTALLRLLDQLKDHRIGIIQMSLASWEWTERFCAEAILR